MINWKSGKPHGSIILAELVPSWKPRYQVLVYYDTLKGYYDDIGENVPESAIERWETIQD